MVVDLKEYPSRYGWHVTDEELFNEHWMPPKQTVAKDTWGSLRGEIAELTKQANKLVNANAKLQDQQKAKQRN